MQSKPSVPNDAREGFTRPRARLATLAVLLAPSGLVHAYLQPPPAPKAFRRWLDQAAVPRLKANASARHGGGTVWYHVAAVERLIRAKAGLAGAGDLGGAR